MCGIHVLVHDNSDDDDKNDELQSPAPLTAVPEWLSRRGPDSVQQVTVVSADTKRVVTLQASVLQMRQDFVKQPVKLDEHDMIDNMYLAWNGEVYQTANVFYNDEDYCNDSYPCQLEDAWQSECSDTMLVADMIQKSIQHDCYGIVAGMTRLLSRLVNAEYAIVIVTPQGIYYARDAFGRRSLLVCNEESSPWQLSSVADSGTGRDWKEVEPGRLHVYNLQSLEATVVDIKLKPFLSLGGNAFLTIKEASETLEKLLLAAVKRRVNVGPVSVLFSGGLDSTVLAALALQVLPCEQTLTLVNVCFIDDCCDNGSAQDAIAAADTLAARASHLDLLRLFPNHSIQFIEHHVTWSEIQEQTAHIERLIYPKSSVMDMNIATALWFAASACPDRIILSGLGADELMGGYGRHRKAWNEGSDVQLRQELEMDLDRLWERNLGRDDRVLSDSAHEARFPFLDQHVVNWLRRLPLQFVCDFSKPPGQGDKRILRLLAERLGLDAASSAVKRAIQFGSRMSHVSDKRRFGSRRQATRMDG